MKQNISFAIAIGIFSTAIFTTSAASAVTISYPTLTNNDTTYNITVTNVQWSGSYNPQIAATLTPGSPSSGTFKTVLSSGNSFLSLRANITNGVVTQTCYYNININNTTGVITAQSSRWTGLPDCSAAVTGSNVALSMKSAF